MRSVIRTIIVAALSLMTVSTVVAQRAIPEDNLAYPVLVTIPGVEKLTAFSSSRRPLATSSRLSTSCSTPKANFSVPR